MAPAVKYDTIEAVAEAMGVEITDQTRPFLMKFVKKAEGEVSVSTNAKKKALLEQAALFGMTDLNEADENSTILIIKIIEFLTANGRLEERADFAAAQNVFVTPEGHIHRIRQAVKPIEERNAGVKEGTVGYCTIELLQNEEYADLTAAQLAEKLEEVYGKKTTAPSVQWYINYCLKKGIEICPRKRAARGKAAAEGGIVLGAELTMEKASAPRGFKKKVTANESIDLDA